MTQLMAAELSGDLLRVALYGLIPQIEDGKRYLVRIDQVQRESKTTINGNNLGIDPGPMTEEEETDYQPELTYGEHAQAKQAARIDLQAINHAHLEPADRSDVAGNEVQPITIKLRETASHDWLDDGEVVPQRRELIICDAPMKFDQWGQPYCHRGYECANSILAVTLDETSDKALVFRDIGRHVSGVCSNFSPVAVS